MKKFILPFILSITSSYVSSSDKNEVPLNCKTDYKKIYVQGTELLKDENSNPLMGYLKLVDVARNGLDSDNQDHVSIAQEAFEKILTFVDSQETPKNSQLRMAIELADIFASKKSVQDYGKSLKYLRMVMDAKKHFQTFPWILDDIIENSTGDANSKQIVEAQELLVNYYSHFEQSMCGDFRGKLIPSYINWFEAMNKVEENKMSPALMNIMVEMEKVASELDDYDSYISLAQFHESRVGFTGMDAEIVRNFYKKAALSCKELRDLKNILTKITANRNHLFFNNPMGFYEFIFQSISNNFDVSNYVSNKKLLIVLLENKVSKENLDLTKLLLKSTFKKEILEGALKGNLYAQAFHIDFLETNIANLKSSIKEYQEKVAESNKYGSPSIKIRKGLTSHEYIKISDVKKIIENLQNDLALEHKKLDAVRESHANKLLEAPIHELYDQSTFYLSLSRYEIFTQYLDMFNYRETQNVFLKKHKAISTFLIKKHMHTGALVDSLNELRSQSEKLKEKTGAKEKAQYAHYLTQIHSLSKLLEIARNDTLKEDMKRTQFDKEFSNFENLLNR